MSETIKLPAARQPVTVEDPNTGVTTFSRPWFLFFQLVFQRLGGSTQTSVDDLTASATNVFGAEETKAQLYTLQDTESQRAEIGDLREQVAELTKAVQDLQSSDASPAELREQILEITKDIQALKQATSL